VKPRKLMLPPFHGERMKGYSEMMAEVTRREVATWPIEEPFELWITLEAIMRVVFGPVETDRLCGACAIYSGGSQTG
jgi:cytochrome P450